MSRRDLNEEMTSVAQKAAKPLRSRYGIWGLATISFVESALIVPIITDPFLIAYIIANKRDTLRAIIVAIVSSVVGGVVAYLIAVGFFEVVVSPYISSETRSELFAVASEFEEGAFILSLTGALTPFPYTFVAIAAGLVKANLLFFILGSAVGRIFRYGFEGWLVYKFGEPALKIVKKQIVATSVLCALLIVLYLVYKF